MREKILIIRFSSFGDIVQTMSVLNPLRAKFPQSDVHWVTRSDMSSLLSYNPMIDKLWSFDRKEGLVGLIKLSFKLRKEGYRYVYDAHSNIRSKIMSLILCPPFSRAHFVRRSKDRLKRILLFKFRKNTYDWPYRGMLSFLKPLKSWGVEFSRDDLSQTWNFREKEIQNVKEKLGESHFVEYDFIALAPSAAWEMKRWPLDHWKSLIRLMENEKFVVLGGPGDEFCQELVDLAPGRVLNLAGKLSLMESSFLVTLSKGLISADTGVLHVADILGVKALALIGPTAFGFPTGSQMKTLDIELPCRPCTKDGRGKCVQDVYQKCMVDISPERVAAEATLYLR
ncbi:glycosyltransferase family 9 protein [Halobacteriovorax sp. GB3]|uniref:glycosyltransferase family 9 protein n=1 Tax=Halobacteriovorax sp. GB3 TaxID=2719615 RepID=UPI002360B428|nr:glycosyltransferase family 9 protein [Halobacteriovorax sp. GB3]MDD0851951.1 glycosyltransferase family 9 protein [Halobacteriovorax sp. GB3]